MKMLQPHSSGFVTGVRRTPVSATEAEASTPELHQKQDMF